MPTHRRNNGLTTAATDRLARLRRVAGEAAAIEPLEQRTMMAADLITQNHPLWHAVDAGKMKIDGSLGVAEWAGAESIVRTTAYDTDSRVNLRMKHLPGGLVIGIDVRDKWLWADGKGGGSGFFNEAGTDDGIALFFDPKNTRAGNLPKTGRELLFNIGKFGGPENGPGAVWRWHWRSGNGKGGDGPVTADNSLSPGLRWAVRTIGTVNNNSDVDTGWTAEVIIPWAALGLAGRPANGQIIGMNFQVRFDDDGGDRREVSYTDAKLSDRPARPVADPYIEAVFSSTNEGNAGLKGPVNYAVVQFVTRNAADRPAAITDLTAAHVGGYGVNFNFTAPAGSVLRGGHVAGYEIRTSSTPILTTGDWDVATVVENNFTPHLRGMAESLRIGELTPSTIYFAAIRARDYAGRLGDIASTAFQTLSTAQDPSGGGRVIVSPNGNTLMYENGQEFIMNSASVGVGNFYLRGLYSGPLYRAGDGQYVDYSSMPGAQQRAIDYFDQLELYGVNTLRVQLEWSRLESANQPRTNMPYGTRWLEKRNPGETQSTFNDDMKDFLHRMMEQAHRTGVRLFLQTFNNYSYNENLDLTAYSTVNGGPITSYSQFFTSTVGENSVLAMAKNRLRVLADWVRESPYAHTVFGFDLVNEWESGSTAANILQRARFISDLAADFNAYAPEINVMNASIRLNPRGPVGRLTYYSDAFDIINTHFYSTSIKEPVNGTAPDKSVLPAADIASLAVYNMLNRRDNRPIHNGEWDIFSVKKANASENRWIGGEVYYTDYPTIAGTPSASKPFYLRDDEALFRTVSWSSIASGMAGPGMRNFKFSLGATWNTGSSAVNGAPFSPVMRQIQSSIARFVADDGIGFDWTNFRARTLAGRISTTSGGGDQLLSWGTADARQGLAYIIRDSAQSTGDATVSGATLRLQGLQAGALYDIEFWSTGPANAVIGSIDNVTAAANITAFAIPTFNTDVMVKFRRVG